MRVAESVLFAGKAIRVLRNPSPVFQFRDPLHNQQIPRGAQKIHGFSGRFPFQKEPFVDANLIGEELLPQSEADKIEAMLQGLKVHFLNWYYHRQLFALLFSVQGDDDYAFNSFFEIICT